MGLWKKIFGKNDRPGTENECSGRKSGAVMDAAAFATGQEDSVFVSLEADGSAYPLSGFELGCGLAGFGCYDKPDILCDNAIILIVEGVRDESSLFGWAFGRGMRETAGSYGIRTRMTVLLRLHRLLLRMRGVRSILKGMILRAGVR